MDIDELALLKLRRPPNKDILRQGVNLREIQFLLTSIVKETKGPLYIAY